MANGLFKGNATYFGRKSGTLEDIVAKINEAPSKPCLLYTSPSPRDVEETRMPSSA